MTEFTKYKIDNKFIFVHVPKNGGKSVWRALGIRRSKNRPTHLPLFATIYPKDAFTFGFVRNPWDRMCSYYHYLCQRQQKPGDSYDKHEIRSIGFKRWVLEYNYHFFEDDIEPKNPWGIPLPTAFQQRSQFFWLEGCTFIGRFERLESDLKLAAKLGRFRITRQLPHINKSKHEHYTHYYDNELIDFIEEHFKRDIKEFNYTYGE